MQWLIELTVVAPQTGLEPARIAVHYEEISGFWEENGSTRVEANGEIIRVKESFDDLEHFMNKADRQ